MPRPVTTVSVLLVVSLAAAACRTQQPAAHPTIPQSAVDPTGVYLERLLAGDRAALIAGFVGQPAIDDPLGGRARGVSEFQRFIAERSAWLRSRSARVAPLRITRGADRTIVEAVLHLEERERTIELPIAVVGDRAPDGRVRAIRVYHSRWPLDGKHTVRPPLLPRDPAAHSTGIVAKYQQALAAGDVDAIVATFESDGYFREPSGGEYVHRGEKALRAFMSQILAAGGIGLEHATVTDDGTVTAIEFNAVAFGNRPLAPQAGLAVYERGATGRLAAARIYDDVNVEELAPTSSPSSRSLP